MVKFCFANIGTVNAPLEQLLIEYGRTPDILQASALLKTLIADIESPADVDLTVEHKLVQATARIFFRSYAFGYTFERRTLPESNNEDQSLFAFKSLPKLPPLTLFERPKEWPILSNLVANCKQLVEAGNIENAAIVLEDWMRMSWQQKTLHLDGKDERSVGYGETNKNLTMLHLAVNCIGIVYADLTEKIMNSVLFRQTAASKSTLSKIDTPDSVTMLVESSSVDQLKSSALLHTANKSIVVTGDDADNLHAFITPENDTLTLYPSDTIRARLLEALGQQSHVVCDLESVRGFRFSTALYANSSTNKYYVLGVYHFKDPKEDWWPEQCGHLLALYHSVLSALPGVESQSAQVIMAGDSNLQTIVDARRAANLLWTNYSLCFGNSLLASYSPAMISSKLSFKAKTDFISKVECVSTSERGRSLIGAIGQPSKCINTSLSDLKNPTNALGKLESSAKICVLFDSSHVEASSLFVGDADKETPSHDLPLDHRWIHLDVTGNDVQNVATVATHRAALAIFFFICLIFIAYLILSKFMTHN